MVDRNAEALRQAFVQVNRAHVGIAVDALCRPAERVDDAGQRRVRVLVARQLERRTPRPGRWWLTRLVRRDRLEHIANPGQSLTHGATLTEASSAPERIDVC